MTMHIAVGGIGDYMNFTKEEHEQFMRFSRNIKLEDVTLLAEDCVELQRQIDELEAKIRFLEFDNRSGNHTTS